MGRKAKNGKARSPAPERLKLEVRENKTAPQGTGRCGILESQRMPSHGLGVGRGGEGASKSPRKQLGEGPTWTHPWPGVGPQSGSAGTGVGILAISALSRRGTRWHPVGGGEKRRPLGSSQTLFHPLPPHTWFLSSSPEDVRAPNSPRHGLCLRGRQSKSLPQGGSGWMFLHLYRSR